MYSHVRMSPVNPCSGRDHMSGRASWQICFHKRKVAADAISGISARRLCGGCGAGRPGGGRDTPGRPIRAAPGVGQAPDMPAAPTAHTAAVWAAELAPDVWPPELPPPLGPDGGSGSPPTSAETRLPTPPPHRAVPSLPATPGVGRARGSAEICPTRPIPAHVPAACPDELGRPTSAGLHWLAPFCQSPLVSAVTRAATGPDGPVPAESARPAGSPPRARWFAGPLVRWPAGSLVRWPAGSLARWFAGPLVRCSLIRWRYGLRST